jgi:uncharacterized metal-binding protein YceD (DUF177 family)
MSDPFKIFVDRLKKGDTQKIEELLDPGFLDINEKDLLFPEKITVKGDAYVTDDHLIVRLKAKTKALMPCAICNEMISNELKVDDFYQAEPLEEIPSAVFDFSELLREALLLGLPKYVECNKGKCPQRAVLSPFFRTQEQEQAEKTTYFPFADIEDLK